MSWWVVAVHLVAMAADVTPVVISVFGLSGAAVALVSAIAVSAILLLVTTVAEVRKVTVAREPIDGDDAFFAELTTKIGATFLDDYALKPECAKTVNKKIVDAHNRRSAGNAPGTDDA